MGYKIQPVSVNEIRSDDTAFQITTDSSLGDLQASIASVGMLAAPILLPQPDGFIVVAGFRRIAACRQLGFGDIESKLLDSEISLLVAAKTAIADNSLQRRLNWIETARAVRLLMAHTTGIRELIAHAADLRMSLSADLVPKLAKLPLLHPAIQVGIVQNRIALPMALILADFSPDIGAALASLFQDLGLGLNKQREVLQMLVEIAERDEMSIPDVLQRPPIDVILAAGDMDRSQRAARIRSALRRLRYPSMSQTEARFDQIVRNMKLGAEVTLHPPRHFEGSRYTLRLTFADQPELERQAAVVQRIIADPDFKAFIEE